MSVRKRIWKTADGTEKQAWVVDYLDQSGKRHIKTFERKKDADAYEATVRVEVRQGTHTADSQSITIKEAGELWVSAGEQNGLERSTTDTYRQHLRNHIEPFIGRVKLSQLTAPMVREFEDRLRKGDPSPGLASDPSPRSPAMVKKVRGSLGALLADAQERGLVARNVVRDLRARRKRGQEIRQERRQKGRLKVGVDIPTREEIKAIVDHAEGRWRAFMLTAVFAGLRSSELRGLRWSDVDLEKKELHVRQRADRYNEIGRPKSETGERTVPLPPMAVNALREWKLACPKGDLGLVFPNGSGKIENHANIVQRGLGPIQIKAGVTVTKTDAAGQPIKDTKGLPIVEAKYTGLHAFRHFYASWCINRRAEGGLELPPKMVQERLGHSTITMTMDVYGHLFPRGDDSEELAAAEKALLG